MRFGCPCFLLSKSLLTRFADDPDLPDATRDACRRTLAQDTDWRAIRIARQAATRLTPRPGFLGAHTMRNAPTIEVYDCKGSDVLPGSPIADPATSEDATARRVFEQTSNAARFLAECFGRNSVDDYGLTLVSSIHLADKYVNAYWDGTQMTYGDADGELMLDFTLAGEIVAHELAHGVTQYTAGFEFIYGEPGALNESMSDAFALMYRHWNAGLDVESGDWVIGADIIGPAAKARGYTCIRDLSDPSGEHCAAPQAIHVSGFLDGGDPHINSGIPNRAFYLAARALGGRVWERTGPIWYAAMQDEATKADSTFREFAKRTRSAARRIYGEGPELDAVVQAWKTVGVLKR